jgi:hemerythrin
MEWTEDLSVGIDTIDEYHKALISRIKDLVTAIKNNFCKYIIGDAINFLERYSAACLSAEERYMQISHYPEYNKHKEQHDSFVTDIHQLKNELLNLDSSEKHASYYLSVETNRVMVDWVCNHILNANKTMGAFLRVEMIFGNKPSILDSAMHGAYFKN